MSQEHEPIPDCWCCPVEIEEGVWVHREMASGGAGSALEPWEGVGATSGADMGFRVRSASRGPTGAVLSPQDRARLREAILGLRQALGAIAGEDGQMLPELPEIIRMDRSWCRQIVADMRWLLERMERAASREGRNGDAAAI